MGRRTVRRRMTRVTGGVPVIKTDTLVAEEPLEIRLNGQSLSITMRTPGDDFELAAGFLAGEGVIARAGDVTTVAYCAGSRTA